MPKINRIKKYEKKIRHNCPTCQATYTLLETHLTKKELAPCPVSCQKVWESMLNKHCQEKVLGQELEQKENDE